MAKLSLTAAPTFTANVLIPVPGKKAVPVEFVFKGRTRDAFIEFLESSKGRDDTDVVMDIVCGWELEDSFSRENVDKLLQNYAGSAKVVVEKYIAEMMGARLGN